MQYRDTGEPADKNRDLAIGKQLARRSLTLWGGLGLAMALFVFGSFYSGWFFVSQAAGRLVAAANAELTQTGTGSEKQAGADTSSVQGGGEGEVAGVPGKQTSDPRYAFLLLGYGGGGHDGAYLTDSMMVVIVDPNQKTLTLLSLPRDIWAPLIFNGQTAVYNKLNTGFAFAKDTSLYRDRLARYTGSQGAGTFVMDTVARLIGIPISYYVSLDFAGFRQMIDLVGGIDVDVPDSFSASYPANDDPEIDPSWMIVRFNKGVQHMSGERAMQYARAREVIDNISEGSDFARSRRQRLIIEAFKTRLTQAGGAIHIPQLLGVANGHLDTNYSVPSAAQLGQLVLDWGNVRFYQAALTNQNYLIDGNGPAGTYILVPDTTGNSWDQVRAFANRLWQDPGLGVAMANTQVVIENDTGVAGAGGRLGTALAKMGYRVGTPTTGPTQASSRLVDGTDGDGAPLLRQLQTDLGVQVSTAPAQGAAGAGKITLQLGSDDARLASLAVPADTAAPSSATGVISGGWSPQPEAPEPTALPALPAAVPTRRTATLPPTIVPRKVLPDGSLDMLPTPTQIGPTSLPVAGDTAAPAHTATPIPIQPHTPPPIPSVPRVATATPAAGTRQSP
jgi:LCP family protein required for cell wall assembly